LHEFQSKKVGGECGKRPPVEKGGPASPLHYTAVYAFAYPLDRFLLNGHRDSVNCYQKLNHFHFFGFAFLGVFEPDSAAVSRLQLTFGILIVCRLFGLNRLSITSPFSRFPVSRFPVSRFQLPRRWIIRSNIGNWVTARLLASSASAIPAENSDFS